MENSLCNFYKKTILPEAGFRNESLNLLKDIIRKNNERGKGRRNVQMWHNLETANMSFMQYFFFYFIVTLHFFKILSLILVMGFFSNLYLSASKISLILRLGFLNSQIISIPDIHGNWSYKISRTSKN